MVIKESKRKKVNYNTGDLLEVKRKDGLSYKCIVVENYDNGFVGKVVSKDQGVGVASWGRYGLRRDGRFQAISECADIKVLAHPEVTSAKSSLSLNESVTKNDLTYYKTDLGDKYATFCICEGFGGWSFQKKSDVPESLKESYFNSQLSKLKTLRESVR